MTSDSILVRKCLPGDYPDARKLLGQLWPERILSDHLSTVFDEILKDKSCVIIGAFLNERLVGMGTMSIRNSLYAEGLLAHVDELVVAQEYRSKGLGKILLDKLISIAQENKCILVELDSALHRDEAHKFYVREKFSKSAFVFTRDITTNK